MRKWGMALAVMVLGAAGAHAQVIQGVHSTGGRLEVGVGFAYDNYRETPSMTLNSAGAQGSAVYYNNYIGAEAQLSDSFGSQGGQTSQILFAGGGVRLRLPSTRTFDPWIHTVVGFTHLSPQPTFGSDSAVGYKVGGGVDFNPPRSRIGFRIGADMFGTHFFNTYQLSPEISAGIVLHLGHE